MPAWFSFHYDVFTRKEIKDEEDEDLMMFFGMEPRMEESWRIMKNHDSSRHPCSHSYQEQPKTYDDYLEKQNREYFYLV